MNFENSDDDVKALKDAQAPGYGAAIAFPVSGKARESRNGSRTG